MATRRQLFTFIVLLLLSVYLLSPDLHFAGYDMTVIFTFLINAVFSGFMLVKHAKKMIFSCSVFHYLFNFFFMFIAPFLQYMTKSWNLSYTLATDGKLIKANLMILLWMIVFEAAQISHTGIAFRLNNMHLKKQNYYPHDVPSKRFLANLIIVSAGITSLFVSQKGLLPLVSARSTGEAAFKAATQAQSSLTMMVSRNIITFTAFFSLYRWRSKRDNIGIVAIALLLMLVLCSPFGTARYYAITAYLGLVVILFPRWIQKPVFFAVLLSGLMILFPALDAVRFAMIQSVSFDEVLLRASYNIRSGFLTGNYDAYVMILKTIDYIGRYGHTHGRQLLGAVLFFVPRGMWSNKPVGTGYMIHNSLGIYGAAANVSSCMVSEAIIDFGIAGIPVYSAVFSRVCKSVDKKLNAAGYDKNISSLVLITLPPMFFFLLRGSFQSVLAFIMSFVVVGGFFIYFFNRPGMHSS